MIYLNPLHNKIQYDSFFRLNCTAVSFTVFTSSDVSLHIIMSDSLNYCNIVSYQYGEKTLLWG